MKFKETGDIQLYVRSMGKMLRVTAAFESLLEANSFMEQHKEQAVVAEIGETILLASVYDKGIAVQRAA